MHLPNGSTSTDSGQLSFSANDQSDDRPLPLLVAEKWSFSLRTLERDETILYCLNDWIVGLTASKNVTQVIKNYRHKGVFSKNAVEIDDAIYVDDKQLYRITQDMRVTKKRPAVAAIKSYLSHAGVFADEVRRNPDVALKAGITGYKKRGKDDKWIADRFKGINDRRFFTDKLSQCVADLIPEQHYARATNLVSTGLFGRDTATLKQELHLTKSQHLRDFHTSQALHYIGLVESTVAFMLDQREIVTWDETVAIIKQVAALFGFQAEQLGQLMGIDLATGRPLLKAGQ